jgi:hypothetical protein
LFTLFRSEESIEIFLLRIQYQLKRVDRAGSLREIHEIFTFMSTVASASARDRVSGHLLISEFLFTQNFGQFYADYVMPSPSAAPTAPATTPRFTTPAAPAAPTAPPVTPRIVLPPSGVPPPPAAAVGRMGPAPTAAPASVVAVPTVNTAPKAPPKPEKKGDCVVA